MSNLLIRAQEILDQEALAIQSIPINDSILQAVSLIKNCQGKIILTGMGKAGIIARKIAATLSSTGTPAIFLHPRRSITWRFGRNW